MDILYISTKLCRLAYTSDQKVMLHGVTRPTLLDEVSRKGDPDSKRGLGRP